MLNKFFSFSISLIFVLINYFLFARFLEENLAWLAFPFSLLVMKWADLLFLKGFHSIQHISKERIAINLQVSGFQNFPFAFRLKMRAFLFIFIYSTLLIYSYAGNIYNLCLNLYELITPIQPILRIEYPSFLNKQPSIYKLSQNQTKIKLDTSSYLSLQILNSKLDQNWKLSLIKDKNYSAFSTYSLDSGKWSSPVLNIYKDFLEKENINFEKESFKVKKLLSLNLQLTHEDTEYLAFLEIMPTPVPITSLEYLPNENTEKQGNLEKLKFSVRVNSEVPLSFIELLVKTKSGYNFTKTIAEFANSTELQFNSSAVELITAGIPFQPEDILYVKVVTKTVITALLGESNELKFPVQTPYQLRSEIIKNLEKALQNLKDIKQFSLTEKSSILNLLSKSAQLSEKISKFGTVRRNLIESMKSVERIQRKHDINYKKSIQKIETTLSLLKRQKQMEEVLSFFQKLQNFKTNLANQKALTDSHIDYFSEADNLKNTSSDLINKIGKLANDFSFLSSKEKLAVQKLLTDDKTAAKLEQTQNFIGKHDLLNAQRESEKAYVEASQHIAVSMQILQQARQRAIQVARKQLQKAGEHLSETMQIRSKEKSLINFDQALKNLDNTPKIGGEFNSILNQAKNETSNAKKFENENNFPGKMKESQLAINDVEKALYALQDEDESDKELQKEQDARAVRSSMDVLAAQGQLDLSWRKKIIEEIAQLKSKGEPSNSPMIRYLESRLR